MTNEPMSNEPMTNGAMSNEPMSNGAMSDGAMSQLTDLMSQSPMAYCPSLHWSLVIEPLVIGH
jgi:hypothetical protein